MSDMWLKKTKTKQNMVYQIGSDFCYLLQYLVLSLRMITVIIEMKLKLNKAIVVITELIIIRIDYIELIIY